MNAAEPSGVITRFPRTFRRWHSSWMLRAVVSALLCLGVVVPASCFIAYMPSDGKTQSGQVSTEHALRTTPVRSALRLGVASGNPRFSTQNNPDGSVVLRRGRDAQHVASTAVDASFPAKDEGSFDWKLIILIFLWYVGNWYHNLTNKLALNAGGGIAGYPYLISTGYLAAGALYALFLWAAPDARPLPQITMSDYLRTLPVSLASAGAHLGSCLALGAGSMSFAQIVKAMEPAFAAVVGTLFYSTGVSPARWLCLFPIIGGVVLASLGELSISWLAFFAAAAANAFAAIKGNENKKLMSSAGFKERAGSIGNIFAITTINSFLFCAVAAFIAEGHKWGSFVELIRSGGKGTAVLNNMIAAGLWFYFYNEIATGIVDKTGAVTQSVLNTAKRAFVMIGAAIVLREGMSTMKLVGSLISIGGVFLYSNIDSLAGK